MARFFKITNFHEIHHGFRYRSGLNILKGEFNDHKYSSCTPGGFYFTNLKNISNYYDFGIYLREVYLPKNDPTFRMVKDGDKWRANKIILGKRYPLYDLKTYKKFKLDVLDNHYLINIASEEGHLHILKWWKRMGMGLHYTSDAMDGASANGHIEVLEWWKKSESLLRYTSQSMDLASKNGHIDVLEWWKNSGLRLRYSYNIIEWSRIFKQYNVVEWWKKSGIMDRHYEIQEYDYDDGTNIVLNPFVKN